MIDYELKHRLAALLAADVAGYSRLMATDDRATVAALDAARKVFRTQIEANQGRVIDMAGDSVLAVFETANGAVAAALAIQKQVNALAEPAAEERRMRFRIGVHLGDVIEKADGTIYGDGVNIAARLEGLAEPGGITVSESIRTAVRGKVAAGFEDQGEQTVKNIPHPVRAYRVRPDGTAPDGPSSAPVATPAPGIDEIDLSLPDKPSIAVLPFTNMSGDPEQEYFTDGISEDIITELSRFHELFVIARNSSFSYKGKSVDVRTVGKELGVRYALEGSIRKSANRVRVTAQLIDAMSGRHIWAEKYDRILEDVFLVQEEITRSIIVAIAPEIEAAERTKVRQRPASLSAYEYAVRAFASAQEARVKHDESIRARAIAEAKEALSIDPGSTLALGAFAHVQWQRLFYRTALDRDTVLADGMKAATRMIELDHAYSRGYLCKGLLLNELSRWDEALSSMQHAHSLNPNDMFTLVSLGYVEAHAGHPESGIEHILQSLRISPREPSRYNSQIALSMAYFFAKDYQNTLTHAEIAAIGAPDSPALHGNIAIAQVGLGNFVKARAAFEEARRLGPEYVSIRLQGEMPFRAADVRRRYLVFFRIAAGLEDPSTAETLC